MRKLFTILLLLSLFAFSLYSEGRDVLILHSYHEGFAWTDDINEAIRARFALEEEEFDLHVEYMDTKRVSPDEITLRLKDLLDAKYQNIEPELIICSDNNAFTFLRQYRDELFGPVPLIFCGVNDYSPYMLAGFPYVTGVVEEIDCTGTIDLITTLQPDVTHIAAISDWAVTGELHEKAFLDAGEEYAGDVELVSLARLSRIELEGELKKLPPRSALILLSYYDDGSDVRLSHVEAVELIKGYSDLPLYSLWDWKIGSGIAGGMVISGTNQGRIVANMALQVLWGTPITSIPVMTEDTNLPLFDYEGLREINGAKDRIPKESLVINQPYSFYEDHKGLVWFYLGILGILVFLIVTLLIDIHQRRKLSSDLREQKNILKSTLDHIPLYVFWKNGDGHILGGNHAFYERFGTSEGELLFSREEYDLLTCLEKRSLDEPVLFWEEQTVDVKGRLRDYIISVVPLDKETPMEKLILIQDISHSRSLEKQLRHAQKMEALGRISGGIAHDVNNTLTGIMTAAELMTPDSVEGVEKAGYIEMIIESCEQAHNLVKSLLAYSRKAPLSFSKIDLRVLLNTTETILRRTIKKSVRLNIKVLAEDLTMMGDKSLIQSALLNMGVNSSDAMPNGGEIFIGAEKILAPMIPDKDIPEGERPEEDRPFVRVEFRDNGEGIPPEILDRLYDPFFTTKEQGRGTGLGLAGVYGTVKSHKGFISVESTPGAGTTFMIYLPLVEEFVCSAASS
ncbi:MAG: ATP-binding protein [Spirochaetales bacterium]|nr:ATP-binding protein [Spirochaetales bacterium]